MNPHSNKIAQRIKQNGLPDRNLGFLHGNTGLCIFFYHLAKKTNNPDYKMIADDLLDNVFAGLSVLAPVLAPVDFENGLTGIGWGIEYLVNNGFAEGNTDEILEEVDNKVFRSLTEDNFTSFELANGLTGYLCYLISRLKNQSNPPTMAQRINRELIILTINKLDELVTMQFPSIVKEICFDLFWRFPVMFYGLYEAFELNIYSEKIRCMLKQWLPNIEAYIPSMHINRLYMATILTKINEIVQDNRMEKQIQILLYATDFEVLKTEVDPHSLNIRLGWIGVVWLMQKASIIIPNTMPNYSLIASTSNEIYLKYNYNLSNMLKCNKNITLGQFGLSDGIAGIGLMELLYPEVFEHINSEKANQYEKVG